MIPRENISPPRWPLGFLRLFIKKEYLEEIEGDMEELFYDNAEKVSVRKANLIYTWEILRLLRPILLKNLKTISTPTPIPMFRNYFKVSLRGFMKTPLSSFINIVGLSIAIGICVFVYGFAHWVYSTDQFHEHKNTVYLMTFLANRDGVLQVHGQTPRPLGEMLKQDFTHITDVCRVEDRSVVVKYNDNVFHERLRFTDPEFLTMLTFPLKWGDSGSLSDINSVILSEEMSVKYFGDENPVGESILIKFDDKNSKAFKVSGVAAEFPKSRTIGFNFLVNFENLRLADPGYDMQDWEAFVNATLIRVNDPADLKAIEMGMDKYKALQNKAVKEEWEIASFGFEQLATLHERSEEIKDDISRSSASNYKSIMFLSVVAVFLLALACFNYINIAIVTAAKRLKEIGVRKTIGATRRVVIVQFLTENVVMTFFALIVGVVLGATLFIPGFEQMWHFDMGFSLAVPGLWIYLLSILLLTAIASGIYPALYISRFEVAGILKGSVQFGKKNPITKTFLGIQLALALMFITTAVMFTQNSAYMAKRGWGYNQEAALYAQVPDGAAFEQLSAVMDQDPDVLLISGSRHHLGKSNTTAFIQMADRSYTVDQLSVDAKYFEAMGLTLAAGRTFRDLFETDKQTVIVNEEFVRSFNPGEGTGSVFRIDSVQYEVIGVVKDFHSYDFFKKVNPTIFKVADRGDFRYLSMRVRPGSENKTYKGLQANWAKLFPETPFQGGYQEDVWGSYFEEISIHATVWKVFGFMAVLLASLGLYGLMSLNIAGRAKEFSIRKVLGAGAKSIAGIIARQYVILFAVAVLLAAPTSYTLIKNLFDASYTYHMPVDFSGVVIAVALLVAVVLITVSTQVRKVLKSDPVNGLKQE